MEAPRVEFIRIALLESIVEAQLLSSILAERQIPHRIRSFHDTAYDGLFQMQKGWGELHAPQSFQLELNEILNDIRQADHGTAAEAQNDCKIEP
ncbi:MAG: hypothetical protein JEZ11_23850 [Desulfobacterales bacterium]|nr:hypothetical protein [Desulfobacterales bacterium]